MTHATRAGGGTRGVPADCGAELETTGILRQVGTAHDLGDSAVRCGCSEAQAEAEAAKASRDQIRRKRDVVGRWQHALQRLLRRMQPLPRCLLRRI